MNISTYVGDEYPKGLIDLKEAAEYVGMASERLKELADTYVVPHWRIDGGEPKFQKAEIRRWISQSKLIQHFEGKSLPISFHISAVTPAAYTGLPTLLKSLLGELLEVPTFAIRPCIYFLCEGDEVVYIGQATCAAARIASHSGKPFTRAFILPCLIEHLNDLEGTFIRAFKPRLNGNNGPLPKREIIEQKYPAVFEALNSQDETRS